MLSETERRQKSLGAMTHAPSEFEDSAPPALGKHPSLNIEVRVSRWKNRGHERGIMKSNRQNEKYSCKRWHNCK